MAKIGKLMMFPLILLVFCAVSQPAEADTSIYVFDPNQSTVVQAGGFAGVDESYPVEGYFQLSVDIDTGLASFVKVDANMLDPSGFLYTENLGILFNMTGLIGTVIDETTIEFEGKTADGTESDVRLQLSLLEDSIHLTGNTTPPPNSADMFFYDVNAVATRKYVGGTGEPNNPYQIATAEDLITLGETPEDYNKHFILTSDIDLDPNLPGRKVFDRAVIAPDVNDTDFYYEFQGIPFSGVFNGNGHTISHLTIEGISNLGLFGQLQEQGEVSNVGLAAVNVNGIYGIGAIVGDNFGGSIADSSSNGSVNGNWFVGGLVGNNSVGSIINCCSTGMVTGKGDIGGLVGHNGYPERSNAVLANCYSATIANGGYRVGGLAGSNDKGNITTCFSTGAVTGIGDVGGLMGNNSVGIITNSYSTGNVSGDEVVGGLVGYNADSNITMSYSSGDVSGGDWTAGGLVGWNYNGSIAMSYSTGTVTGKWIIGGLVGYNAESSINTSYSSSEVIGHGYIGGLIGCNEDSNITMSYSIGVVTGNEDVGGLVGYNWLNSSDVGSTTFSFWDMESSGQTTSAVGEGKTTSEMQTASMFLEAGWDFVGETENGTEDIWWILEGRDYPRLWWERVLFDDFEDGEALLLWQNYEPDSEKIRVVETNGRLEVYAVESADDIVAGYISGDWRLDVTQDFALRVDFHFSKQTIGDSWVLLLLLPSLEEPIDRYVEIEAGCIDNQPFYLYEEVDGAFMREVSTSRNIDDGKLYISYDADKDEVYLSYTGYGKANAWQTVEGLLQSKWAAEPLYVAIGGGSDRVILEEGDAYLDNFVIDSGLLDFSAEPDDTGADEP